MRSLNYTSRMSRAPSSAVVRVTGLDGADVEHSIMAAKFCSIVPREGFLLPKSRPKWTCDGREYVVSNLKTGRFFCSGPQGHPITRQ